MSVSFALPIDVAMKVAAELRTHGRVVRGQLGVQVQEVTPELACSFGLQGTVRGRGGGRRLGSSSTTSSPHSRSKVLPAAVPERVAPIVEPATDKPAQDAAGIVDAAAEQSDGALALPARAPGTE